MGILHLELPQRGVAEGTRRRPVADVQVLQVLAGPVCRRGRVGHVRVRFLAVRARFLAVNAPPSRIDVSIGRDDGRNDVRVAVLVGNAPIVFHSIHVSIVHLDVLGPLLARIPRVRASLVRTASTHPGGRPDGDVTGAWLGFGMFRFVPGPFDVMFSPRATFRKRPRRERVVSTQYG